MDFMENAILKANERFAGLTRAEQRVMVANDAIWQVTHKSIVPYVGTYFYPMGGWRQPPVELPEANCIGCGIACLFAGLADHQVIDGTATEYFSEADIHNSLLGGVFGEDTLKSVEMTFEGWGGGFYQAFFEAYPNATDRFIAIAANIVHHGGEFLPGVLLGPERIAEIVRRATVTPTPTLEPVNYYPMERFDTDNPNMFCLQDADPEAADTLDDVWVRFDVHPDADHPKQNVLVIDKYAGAWDSIRLNAKLVDDLRAFLDKHFPR
jgi:hypothetical protein